MFTNKECPTNHHDHNSVNGQEFLELLASAQPRHTRRIGSRQIHLVPPQVRLKGSVNRHVYDPLTVSLGPYHHGKPELQQAQEFKYTSLDWFGSGSNDNKTFYYKHVMDMINDIRCCYAEVTIVDKYDDKELAFMMLLDACFVINFIETRMRSESNFHEWRSWLGMAAAVSFASRDIMVLENQIPFRVIKLLIGLRYGMEEGERLVDEFMGWMMIGKTGFRVKIPGGEEDPPLHILEACWRVVVGENCRSELSHQQSRFMIPKKNDQIYDNDKAWTSQIGRSIMDLKAKGIRVVPSLSTSIRDIKFDSFAFHGQLQLPVRYISESTRVTITNMIAYEVSPDSNTDLVLLSYTSFMKSLIQSPNDVKECQERGILFNKLGNNKEVVRILKEIGTFGLVNYNIYEDVTQRIRQHCKNKSKTWMADLIHTWFQSPWTVIALLGTILLLCLTFLQTYYTINPLKKD